MNMENQQKDIGMHPEQEMQTETVDTQCSVPQEQVSQQKEPPQGQTVSDEAAQQQQGVLTVKFNHQTRSLSHDEAVQLAQKGLKYEAIEPMMNSLRQAATVRGIPMAQLAAEWQAHAEAMRFSDAVRRCGGNEQTAVQLMRAEAAAAKRQSEASVTDRLAAEWMELQHAVPDVASIDDLPAEVLQAAAQGRHSLLDGYLRYQNAERIRIERAKNAADKAAAQTTGVLAGTAPSVNSPAIEAMLAGVRRSY